MHINCAVLIPVQDLQSNKMKSIESSVSLRVENNVFFVDSIEFLVLVLIFLLLLF